MYVFLEECFSCISEESATERSSGDLACYLTEHLDFKGDYIFEQGRAMGCTSILTASVEVSNAIVTNVKVGGFASVIGAITISV